MSTYSFEQWLAAAEQQPELPEHLPDWLRPVVEMARSGDMYEQQRKVPKEGVDGTPPRYSAVLVLPGEAPEAAEASAAGDPPATILLTHRAPSMRTHSGQMAFPGGARESQDSGPIATALREANEETGLDPDSVEPVALIRPLYIDRTNFAVVPVLAYWRQPHPVHPATTENDWVQPLPLSELTDPDKRFLVECGPWHGPAFYVDKMVLWGFTGGVVNELLKCAGWERPWDKQRKVDLFTALEKSANGEALSDMWDSFRGEFEGELNQE